MLSHWSCFTWKFFMIWFHKILKLIFQTQPSCHRNICTEHWRKLPNLTAFLEIYLYLKNNDSIKHVYKVLLNVLFIYFNLCKFAKFLKSFLKAQVNFPANFASMINSIKQNSSVLFSSNIIYFGQTSRLKS